MDLFGSGMEYGIHFVIRPHSKYFGLLEPYGFCLTSAQCHVKAAISSV